MRPSLTLFEDSAVQKLSPLALLRPAWELRTGFLTLREKFVRAYGVEPDLHCRTRLVEKSKQLAPTAQVNEASNGAALFLNGRIMAGPTIAESIPLEGPDALFEQSGQAVAVRAAEGSVVRFNADGTLDPSSLTSLPRREVDVDLANFPWDLVRRNPTALAEDAARMEGAGTVAGNRHPTAAFVNERAITVRPGATIGPFAVLDASDGPIVIDANATIMAHATIIGPAYVGRKSTVKVGAKLYGGTMIGPVCKVGGEIEGSIIHGYSNKQHEGFLGHAYVGEWCNLGADTNNSDLKNNYGSVRVTINGEEIDTGQQFVGLFLGDHAKSGINTMFNTGTVVGVASNVFGPGYPPKAIPSFAWFDTMKGMKPYDLEKALEVAERVMARRKIPLTDVDRTLLTETFRLTESERTTPQ